jgi:hypothetical protein
MLWDIYSLFGAVVAIVKEAKDMFAPKDTSIFI